MRRIGIQIFLPIFFLLITYILSNCTSKPASVKPTATDNSTTMRVDSVAVRENDTVPASTPARHNRGIPSMHSGNINAQEQHEQGSIVYYCPSRMLENADNNVTVTITKAALDQAIKQLEEKFSKVYKQPVELFQHNVAGSSISIATKMKVELMYSEKNEFEIISKPDNVEQIFDGTNELNWDWIIKPLKVGPTQLSIIISAYDKKFGRWVSVQTPPKIISINVQIDPRGYFSKLWGFLEAHPEWIFMQIIFPIIAFFVGRKRKKQ